MTAQTWTSIRQTVAIALTQTQSPYVQFPPNFEAQFPQGVSYAEGRIHRDIPMLAIRREVGLVTVANSRSVSVSEGLIIERFGLLLADRLLSYMPVSLDFIDLVWPDRALAVTPSATSEYGRYWALAEDGANAEIVIAPTPDAVYTALATALMQPESLAPLNPSTYLSRVYPELLVAGIMVFMTGALTRNFGAQADEPQSAMSWERQYQTLMFSARREERRRRGLAPDVPGEEAPQQQATGAA